MYNNVGIYQNMDLNSLIIENIDDVGITKPEAMHKLILRLEEINQENEEYMDLLLERLDDMVITWEQPWYQKTYLPTRPTTEEDEDENSKSETYRTDSFTPDESKIVRKNWKRFRKEFQLPDKPICIARWRNKNPKHPKVPQENVRHFVISYLALGLERSLYQVYRYFLTEYGGPVKGPYTAQEEKIMEICLHHCPKDAVLYLSALLSREPRDVFNQLHYMLNRKPELKEKIKGKLDLATKYCQKKMKHSGNSFKEFKNRTFDPCVWHKFQEDVSQPYYKLQKFWYHQRDVLLYTEYDVLFTRLGKKLMEILQSTTLYEMWADINWDDVAKRFSENFSPTFLKAVAYKFIRRYLGLGNKWLREPLIDIVNRTLHQLKTMPTQMHHIKSFILNSDWNVPELDYNVKMRL